MRLSPCRHCGREVTGRNKAPRGLCVACYGRKDVRVQYPLSAAGQRNAVRREPTEAELEAMIAEQLKCLPEWWGDDSRYMQKLAEEGMLPNADDDH